MFIFRGVFDILIFPVFFSVPPMKLHHSSSQPPPQRKGLASECPLRIAEAGVDGTEDLDTRWCLNQPTHLTKYELNPWRIHATGIFTYMKTMKINYINVGKCASPMDG